MPPGRKVSENRGMIGNRIPSTASAGNVNALIGNNTGSSGRASPAPGGNLSTGSTVPAPKTSERAASPEGSVNSSTASNALGTGSPATSRSSSPPTSPGGDLPPSLVIATHPDGGPGAMTPSSTRAEAGDTGELSAPSTPIVGAQAEPLPAPEYDLVPQNLKLAADMHRGLSAASVARSFAPSVASSLMSQYDPSNQGNEEKQMMQDVSGISTPTGTPRAANRELDGSTRGEGSVAGDGSVIGDSDLEEVKNRLDSLDVGIDRDPTPEPVQIDATGESEADSTATEHDSEIADVSGDAEKAVGGAGNVEARDEAVAAGTPDHQTHSANPNSADDLKALKAGELSEEHDHDPSYGDRPLPAKVTNPVNSLASMGFMQNLVEKEVSAGERKEQKGMAGQRMEDIERPDEIIPPTSSAGDASVASEAGEVKVEEASEPTDAVSAAAMGEHATDDQEPKTERAAAADHEQAELNTTSKEASAQKDGPSKSEKDAAAGKVGPDAGAGDNVNLTETFGMREPAARPTNKQEAREAGGEGEESGSEGETDKPPKIHGTLGGVEHTDHVGPDEPSVLERIGVGQSQEADARREQIEEGFAENGLLDYPSQEDQLREHSDKDQREGKTLVGELQKMAAEEKEEEEAGVVQPAEQKDPDERGNNSIPNPFKKDDGKTHTPATAFIAPRALSPGHGILDPENQDDDPIGMTGVQDLEPATEKKPLQIQIEPAPIAQPAKDTPVTQSPIKGTAQSGGTTPTPVLPSPPADEPDNHDLDPPASARSVGTGASTPIDPHFLKSFPKVPDEERPRIEVHLSPHATPFVPRNPLSRQNSSGSAQAGPSLPTSAQGQSGSAAADKQATDRRQAGETAGSGLGDKVDLADVPSVHLSNLNDAKAAAAEGQVPELAPQTPPSPSKVYEPVPEHGVDRSHADAGIDENGNTRAVKLTELDTMDPRDPRTEGIRESRSYSNSSLDVSDKESIDHGNASKAKKRLSRKAPKSSMLDDEDPGDWVPGEDGWAVVTK